MQGKAADLFTGVVPFLTTAEAKSFGVAARKLGLTPSAVSKAITRLEAKLGLRLLNRSARHVSLTEEGATFLRGCQAAVTSLRAAEAEVAEAQRSPRGRLTVSLPLLLGKLVVLPALKQFCDRHPALTVFASLTDRVVSLADEEVDAVVRVGTVAESRATARKLRDVSWVTVAAPDYLARRGVPRVPSDLASHDCLKFMLPNGVLREWEFATPGTRRVAHVATRGTLIADNGEGLVAAAGAGLGVFQAHDYAVADDLARGRLIEVLANWKCPGPSISLVVAPGKRAAPKVRAFAEFMRELLS